MKILHAFFTWFGSLWGSQESEYFTGIVDDPRTPEQKQYDYLHEERLPLAGATAAFDNTPIYVSPYPDENQLGVGSCVPHGVGRALAIKRRSDLGGTYVRLAYSFVYRLRSNYPQPGSWLQEIFQKYKDIGAPLYTSMQDPATEQQATALVITPQMRLEAEIYKGKEYYTINIPTIDTVAAVAARGIAVPIIFYSTYQEWARQYPTILDTKLNSTYAEVRHCVYVLPKSGYIKDGKKYVVIQDSAWFGNRTIRHLDEEFFNKRVFGAGYWDTVKLLATGPMPKYRFTKILKVGSRNDDVRNLQLMLISLGLLPADCATGYFGGRTLAGLHAFQNQFADEILIPLGLDAPTDTFGSACIAKANKLTA